MGSVPAPDIEAAARLRARAKDGAERVISECLGLARGDILAIFYDQSTTDCADLLIKAAEAGGVTVNRRFVRTDEQIEYARLARLPNADFEAMCCARAVLLCLSSTLEATPYRKLLVKSGVDDHRLGTMPGATLEVLAHAVNVDYAQAWQRCAELALAMLIGDCAVLTSYLFDRGGNRTGEHLLRMHFGEFKRSPITSPGIIDDGTWGNLPGGETFITPLEHRATGSFVLNGAFTGCVMQPHDPILLDFESGRLCHVEGSSAALPQLRRILRAAERDAHPLEIAELGVGVNPGVGELRGNALFDEKKEGTAHIAVGDNREYGGLLTSAIHEDFITRAPSLTIDGKPVLDQGTWALRPSDWREDYAQTVALGAKLPESFMVQQFAYEARVQANGNLLVRRPVGAKRLCAYTIGEESVSRDLARVFRLIPQDFIRFDLLSAKCREERLELDRNYLRGLVAVLQRHQLAAIEAPGDWDI